MTIFLVYIIILAFICVRDFLRKPTAADFVVAGRNQGVFGVYASLVATIIGASATIGVAESAKNIGWPAIWWLAAGAVGLLLQAAFLTSRIAKFKPCSLPELAEKLVSSRAKKIAGSIIAIAWIGIVAAQFYIGYEFIKLFSFEWLTREWGVIIAGAITICYTMCGGQLSVVRTDKLQAMIIIAAFIAVAIAIAFGGVTGVDSPNQTLPQFELLNSSFGWEKLVLMLFAAGGAFFLGPDVVSRSFIARTPKHAKLSTVLAAVTILALGIIITFMGLWDASKFPSSNDNPLIHISTLLPLPLKLLFSLGLISVLLSSANTCLINCAVIVNRDILNCGSVRSIRLTVLAIGLVAISLAFLDYGIIELLLLSYSIYTPGIAIPLAVALFAHSRGMVHSGMWLSAAGIGGFCGLISAIMPTLPSFLPIFGGCISLILSVLAIKKK